MKLVLKAAPTYFHNPTTYGWWDLYMDMKKYAFLFGTNFHVWDCLQHVLACCSPDTTADYAYDKNRDRQE